MTLQQFLAKWRGQPEKKRRFAEKAGTTVNYLEQIAGGARRPSPDLALAIQKASSGRVKAAGLLLTPKKQASKEEALAA